MSETNTNISDAEAVDTAPIADAVTTEATETTAVSETDNQTKEEVTLEVSEEMTASAAAPTRSYPARGTAGARGKRPTGAGGRAGAGGARGRRPQTERVKPEFDQKILDIRRVVRVVSGGRRFSFSVSIAIGDRNGRVGLGSGKSSDTSLAIEKAIKDAKKKMITLKLTKNNSIPHDLSAKFASSKIFMMPNKSRGLIAGSSARILLNLAGVKDVTAKFFSGSKNKMNNGKVTMKALEAIAYKHGEGRIVSKVEMVESVDMETEIVVK